MKQRALLTVSFAAFFCHSLIIVGVVMDLEGGITSVWIRKPVTVLKYRRENLGSAVEGICPFSALVFWGFGTSNGNSVGAVVEGAAGRDIEKSIFGGVDAFRGVLFSVFSDGFGKGDIPAAIAGIDGVRSFSKSDTCISVTATEEDAEAVRREIWRIWGIL